MGKKPDNRIILASYEADFAASWGRKARDLLEGYGPDFFNILVRSDSSAANRWDLEGYDLCGRPHYREGQGSHWLPEYEDERASFSTGSHDDQVDVTSYAVKGLLESVTSKAARPFAHNLLIFSLI